MRYFPKETAVLTLVVASLILLAFALLMPTNTIANVSALEADVGVYWDSNCAKPVDDIDWENLTPGSSKSKIVYIQHKNPEPIYLRLSTKNWTPPEAYNYMELRWDYPPGHRMNPDDVLQITLTLRVDSDIKGILSFRFTIVIEGTDRLPGDVNRDDKVDWMDVALFRLAYGSKEGDANYNLDADFDENDTVDWLDMAVLLRSYIEYYS